MEFVQPSFLWALSALGIPVLIHLFHFRRFKTIYFTNVRFLREVRQERTNVRNIKRWLLLATRLLAILFLVSAFAQPYLKGADDQVSKTDAVSVFFDNSHSMSLPHEGVELLEWARDRSRDIVNSFGEGDVFLVLTHDLKLEEQRWKSKQEALEYIETVRLSNRSVPLRTVIDKQDYLFTMQGGRAHRRFLVSDFQESMIKGTELRPDSLHYNYLVQLRAEEVRNIYIDSVWMTEPVSVTGGVNTILYRVVNSSAMEAPDVRISLEVNGQVRSVREVDLMAMESRTDTLHFNIFKEGWQLCEIALSDYPVVMDDLFWFSFHVPEKVKVLEITGPESGDIISRVFEEDPYVQHERRDIQRLNYSSFQEYGLIVLNGPDQLPSGLALSLGTYLDEGGHILLVPACSMPSDGYANLLSRAGPLQFGPVRAGNYTVNIPDLSEVLLRDVVDKLPDNTDMPSVDRYHPLVSSSRIREHRVLRLNNGDGLLTWYPGDRGHLFVQGVPFCKGFSDLQDNWIYAPLLYNIALFRGLEQELYHFAGSDQWISVPVSPNTGDDVLKITGEEVAFIPEQRLVDNRVAVNTGRSDMIPAGHYRVSRGEDDLAWLSYNTSRLESVMGFPTLDELRQRFPAANDILDGTAGTSVAAAKLKSDGRPLWKWALALALLFFITEVALLRWLPE